MSETPWREASPAADFDALQIAADDDRVRALDALRESEERYRELFENANDMVYTQDLAGRITSVNRATERLSGYTRAELLTLTIDQLVESSSRPVMRAMLERKLAGEERTIYEVEMRAKDGRSVPLEVSARLILRDGIPAGVQGIARDITERKRAEELLRQSEERFRLLVENSSDGIYLVAADGLVVYASRPVTRILGYGIDELVGRHFLDLLHPDDRDPASWFFADILSKPGLAINSSYRCLHKDGAFRNLEAVGVNRLDESGVAAIILNFRDVTERKRAEHALLESEERFRAVFESALVGIARLDLSGRIVDTNRAMQEMFGYLLDELRGRPLRDFVHPEEADPAARDFKDLAEGTIDHCRAERRIIRKDAHPVWVNLTASLVRDATTRPRFCLAMLENITERKHAESALQDTNRRLADWVSELEQRKREISLLSEMGDMLRACRSPEEAYGVIEPMASQLFPLESGSVSVLTPGTALVETVAQWGAPIGHRLFSVDDCWALRRGRPHLVEQGRQGLVCKHLGEPDASAYICVPMMAQGELLGLLHMAISEKGRSVETRQRFVMTVAEHIALALANLKLRETLRSQSIRDPLTGLFNRRYMEESLEREMRRASRGRHPVGIIMLDLDHFKKFNDSYGHDAGDALMRIVGNTLQRSIRAEDIACRYGGEEFTLILPEASLVDAAQRAESIRESIRNLNIQHRRQQLGGVTISAGVAIFPDHGPTGDAVLRAADAALYQAKSRGRDRVAINHAGGIFADAIVDLKEGR
jgi:diguanylate cyclase (GGDEF)-like protein/PAS domain S-box-containing protein